MAYYISEYKFVNRQRKILLWAFLTTWAQIASVESLKTKKVQKTIFVFNGIMQQRRSYN